MISEQPKPQLTHVFAQDFISMCLVSSQKLQKAFQMENQDEFFQDQESDFHQMTEEKEEKEINPSKNRKQHYHNFQKHLITTLKKNINPLIVGEEGETKEIEIALWEKFVSTERKTKTLISLTFGNCEGVKQINAYGYEKIYENPSELIRRAKKNIQKSIIYQLKTMDLEQVLKGRRIGQKANFILYLRSFIETLQKGTFESRFQNYNRKRKSSNEN